MRKSILILLPFLLLAACSSLTVVPQPVENGFINKSDNSLTIAQHDLEIRARLADSGINAYNLEKEKAFN